jgi:diketogulonate reductase-like aldo/keto reductase
MALAVEPAQLISIADRVEIAPDVWMPRLGLGTSRASGRPLVSALLDAFDLGYRLVDTSANYENEEMVGAAIASTRVPRDELFITTKLEGPEQGRHRPRPALEASLRGLGLDYVDLYLIHWPQPSLTNDTWHAMEELLHAGLTRAIGVSNFEIDDLEQLRTTMRVPPAVNQFKFNPLEQRRGLRRYCGEHGIVVEAWAPVLRGRANEVDELAELARTHGKTAVQVALRWLLQHGAVAIPKTVHEARLRENAELYDFVLTDEEMRRIDALAQW